MGTRMLRRGFGAVLLGVATCALTLPTAAHAEEGSDPIIAGDCAATFENTDEARGTPLTADAGAVAEAPGVLTVGTGSESAGTNGHAEPLVKLPASDTLDEVGASSTPVVSEAAGDVCRVAKPVANEAGAAVQKIVPVDDVTEPGEQEPPDEQPPDEQPPDDEQPENPPAETPGAEDNDQGASGAHGPIAFGPGSDGANDVGGVDLPTVLGDSFDSLGSITLPPAVSEPPVQAPDLNPNPDEDNPKPQANESGSAHTVSSDDSPQRLPLLLAVIALALVVAALSKSVYSRKSS